MSCITRNLIYAIFCINCGFSYVGETVNLTSRMAAHRSNSKTLDNGSQEVSLHLHSCAKGFHILPLFKLREENKIARLVKENYFIKLLKPDLNTGQRNILLLNWFYIFKETHLVLIILIFYKVFLDIYCLYFMLLVGSSGANRETAGQIGTVGLFLQFWGP